MVKQVGPEERHEVAASPLHYLSLLAPRKWLIVGIALVVFGCVAAWTFRQPKVFEASCVIQYNPNPTKPLGSKVEGLTESSGAFWANHEFYKSENAIIASRSVAERVVRQLALHADSGFTGGREMTVADAARRLQERLTVEPERNTRLVSVRVRDQDPKRAATLANAIADAYIEKALEDKLSSTVSALDWLNQQMEKLRGQLESSELALHDFKRDNNVLSVSMEDRQNLVAGNIEQFSKALAETRTRRIEQQARVARYRALVDASDLEGAVAALPGNDSVAALRGTLREKSIELEKLSQRYGAKHPTIEAIAGEVAAARRALAVELEGLLKSAEADLTEARATETGLTAALAEAQSAGLELNLRQIEYERLNRARENNRQLYELLLQRTTETDLARLFRVTQASVVDPALAPKLAISPKIGLSLGVGGLLGLVLGVLCAVALVLMDTRLKSADAVEALGVTVLGIVPQLSDEHSVKRGGRSRGGTQRGVETPAGAELVVHTHPSSAVAECCRTIRTNLTFMAADEPLRTMVVTSPGPGEGKTTVATSLAIAMAQSGKRVLLIDADLRRPRLHKVMGTPGSSVGLTNVLVGQSQLRSVIAQSGVPNLDVITSGPIPPNPAELLHTRHFRDVIADASELYDVVMFDSPPLGPVTDAAIIAPQVSGAVLVVKSGQTARPGLVSALRQLRDVGANIIGSVFNAVDLTSKGYGGAGYYYYRRYGYYYGEGGHDSGAPTGTEERDVRA